MFYKNILIPKTAFYSIFVILNLFLNELTLADLRLNQRSLLIFIWEDWIIL